MTIDKKKKINQDQCRTLEDLMCKMKWDFKVKAEDASKFIAGTKLPESVKKLLTQAYNSEQKLAGEAMKLLKKVNEDGDVYKNLKKGYTEAQQHIQDLKHISDFKELPNADVQLTQQTFNDAMVKAPLVSNMLFVCLFVLVLFVCLFVLVCLFVFMFCLLHNRFSTFSQQSPFSTFLYNDIPKGYHSCTRDDKKTMYLMKR